MVLQYSSYYKQKVGKSVVSKLYKKKFETNQAKNAFDYLYQHADKESKKKMIDTYNKAQK